MANRITLLIIGVLLLVLLPNYASADEFPIQLESPKIDTHDIASIQRGAKHFASYCLVCHSLLYMEHDPIAKAAGITPNRMPDKSKNWWFGTSPPDLTLMAKVHGADWLYTYLHVFYKDPRRPTGSNNLLIDNVNMPNPFIGFQGEQILITKKKELYLEAPLFVRKVPYYTVLQLVQKGGMTSDQFDTMTADLVNFLVYASEPKKYARERGGIGVLIFLAIFFVLAWLLKRAIWKKLS